MCVTFDKIQNYPNVMPNSAKAYQSEPENLNSIKVFFLVLQFKGNSIENAIISIGSLFFNSKKLQVV